MTTWIWNLGNFEILASSSKILQILSEKGGKLCPLFCLSKIFKEELEPRRGFG